MKDLSHIFPCRKRGIPVCQNNDPPWFLFQLFHIFENAVKTGAAAPQGFRNRELFSRRDRDILNDLGIKKTQFSLKADLLQAIGYFIHKLCELPVCYGAADIHEKLDAIVSRELIENIFFKNSPLHDGALIIRNHRIAAARCILPVSDREDISTDLGLRHRSAIGVTVLSDAVVVVVSEQTGSISLCRGGDITHGISPVVLETMLKDIFVNKKEPVTTEKVEENDHEQ